MQLHEDIYASSLSSICPREKVSHRQLLQKKTDDADLPVDMKITHTVQPIFCPPPLPPSTTNLNCFSLSLLLARGLNKGMDKFFLLLLGYPVGRRERGGEKGKFFTSFFPSMCAGFLSFSPSREKRGVTRVRVSFWSGESEQEELRLSGEREAGH